MPLIYQHSINSITRLGLWHISEQEDFFLSRVPLRQHVAHPHKRLQHLAGRLLLTELFPDFPLSELLIADTRKPYLPGEQYHFSISHCGHFAAAIVSAEQRVGIDAEIPSEKIYRISHKFMHPHDIRAADLSGTTAHMLQLLTLCWSAKEALFKWYGLGNVDFREHLRILRVHGTADEGTIRTRFLKEIDKELTLSYRLFPSLVLSWVAENY